MLTGILAFVLAVTLISAIAHIESQYPNNTIDHND